eukprot:11535047-Ditylum_brightwellii.AAC.1
MPNKETAGVPTNNATIASKDEDTAGVVQNEDAVLQEGEENSLQSEINDRDIVVNIIPQKMKVKRPLIAFPYLYRSNKLNLKWTRHMVPDSGLACNQGHAGIYYRPSNVILPIQQLQESSDKASNAACTTNVIEHDYPMQRVIRRTPILSQPSTKDSP